MINNKIAMHIGQARGEDNTFLTFGKMDKSDVDGLMEVSFYRYNVKTRDFDGTQMTEYDFLEKECKTLSHPFNFYDNFMPDEYFESVANEDMEILMEHMFGLRAESKDKFKTVIQMLLEII